MMTCQKGTKAKPLSSATNCHEELLHNPVLLPEDVERLSEVVKARCIGEEAKEESLNKLAERIKLFHEIIDKGLNEIETEVANKSFLRTRIRPGC